MALLLVSLLIISSIAFMFSGPAVSQSQPSHSLGFWLQDSSSLPDSQTFFNAMFLTPPYPSSLQVMIFAPLQDQINGYNPSSPISYTVKSINYWGQVATMADSYPNIRLVFDIAFNPTSTTYGLSDYQSIVAALAKHSSVFGLGVEGEYTHETSLLMTTAMGLLGGSGKQFVNYYPAAGVIPLGGYYIIHTNFPGGDNGGYDQVGSLQKADSQAIGLDSGYYSNYPFPSSVSCSIGATAITSSTMGWNQCVVSTELKAAVSFPQQQQRQFLELDVGFSGSGSFIGVSGHSTNQLWDNPKLRNWIWTDANYQGNFILSTGSSASFTTTSSSTTSIISSTSTTLRATSSTTSTSTTTSSVTTTTSSNPQASYNLATHVGCPSGIQYCGNASPVGNGAYPGGSTVTLTAYPYGGFVLNSWTVCTSTCQTYYGSPTSLVITGNTQATANFVRG